MTKMPVKVQRNPVSEMNQTLDHFRSLLNQMETVVHSDVWTELEEICSELDILWGEIDAEWEWK